MSDKLQLETGDALLQEDGSSFILTIAAADAPKTYPPVEVPPSRRPLAIAALTIGLSLLQSTLAPAPAAALTVTQSTTLIQSKRPAPSWDPPNLLTSTLAPVAAVSDLIKPLDWPLPRVKAAFDLWTWTQNRPSYYVNSVPPEIRLRDWPNPRLKAEPTWRTWTQPRPSYYTDAVAASAQPVTQSSTLVQSKRPAPLWTAPNLLQTTLAAVVAGDPPFKQRDWLLPQTAKPRPVATLQIISYYVFSVQQDPFFQTELSLPKLRQLAPQTWTQNLLETTLATAAAQEPFKQRDWPTLPGKAASLTLRTWIQARPTYFVDTVIKPFSQTDWPNPRPFKPAPQVWLQSPAIPSQTPPAIRQYDWPNPRLKASSFDPRTWIQSRPSYYVDAAAAIPPFKQCDWTNPATPKPAPRDWTQRPAIPGFTPEIRLYDWPNPRVKPAAFNLRAWIQQRPLFYTEPQPFAQRDWPPPKPFKPAPRDWTWRPAIPEFHPEIRLYDWPNPRLKSASIDLWTWIQKRPTYYVESTDNLVVTIHTVGLDIYQTVGAGLDIRPDPGAGLDVYATGTAGLDISATPAAGVSDRAAPAGLDIGQSLPAGLSDAT